MFICVFSLYPSNTTTQPPSVSTNVVVDPTILLLIPVLCQRYCSLGKVCNMKPSRRLTFSWFLSNLSTFRGFNEFPNSISNGDTVPCTVKKKKKNLNVNVRLLNFLASAPNSLIFISVSIKKKDQIPAKMKLLSWNEVLHLLWLNMIWIDEIPASIAESATERKIHEETKKGGEAKNMTDLTACWKQRRVICELLSDAKTARPAAEMLHETAFHYLFICKRQRDVDGDYKYKHRFKCSDWTRKQTITLTLPSCCGGVLD